MSPIRNIAASILAAARISDGRSAQLSSPQEPHREPSIGVPASLVDGPGADAEPLMLPGDVRFANLADVVELQRAELTRVLRENRRLNERVDQMVKLYEREQVLRQQMHATLQRLSSNRRSLSLAQPRAPIEDKPHEVEQKYLALKQSVAHLVTYIQRLNQQAGSK